MSTGRTEVAMMGSNKFTPLALIEEDGQCKQEVLQPTFENIKKIKPMKTTATRFGGGPRTTAFSTISGFSQMSTSSFFKMLDSPFGNFGMLPGSVFN